MLGRGWVLMATEVSQGWGFVKMAASGQIVNLSAAAPVSMGESWFELADPSHFWIRRRFDVLKRLFLRAPVLGSRLVDIGCGTGLFQGQLEEFLDRPVDGIDLNETVLRQNDNRRGMLYLYDICERHPRFEQYYDTVFLFDVLEHIAEESAFLDAVLFHLAEDGLLFINVPAHMALFSDYDVAVGHRRRYDASAFRALMAGAGLEILDWTYWGLPMMPLLFLRKILSPKRTDREVIRSGFDSRGRLLNGALMALSRMERIPQRICGTSLMAVVHRRRRNGRAILG